MSGIARARSRTRTTWPQKVTRFVVDAIIGIVGAVGFLHVVGALEPRVPTYHYSVTYHH